jgi:hypothetical protein
MSPRGATDLQGGCDGHYWAPPTTGTTLSFHQDHLRGPADRKAMKVHWEQVIERLPAKL